jgi:glycosyltransferase involved in cell wall biosynthesis
LPDHGAFPELIEATGGGLPFRPNDAGDLARALAELLANAEHLRSLGRCGREAVVRDFDVGRAAGKIVEICDGVIRETRA